MSRGARTSPVALLGLLVLIASCGSTGASGSPGTSGSSVGASSTPSALSCSPQPCGTSGGVTLTATGLTGYPHKPDPSCTDCPPNTLVEMPFTVNNGSQSDLQLTNTVYKIEPGSGQSVYNLGAPSGWGGTLPDGHTCYDNSGDLQPGAHSDPLVACFSLSSAQLAQPLKLIWGYHLGNDVVGTTIDLSSLTIQTGPAL